MLTLAIDTTAEFGSIALVDAEGVREEVLIHAPEGFSGPLFDRIGALLERLGVRLEDVQLFAAAAGPGSFTGVRVGLAAVKGLAEVLGRPIAPVSSLRALAELGTADLRATVIDARRGEVFAALFDRAGRTVIDEIVTPFPRFVEMIGTRDFEWISSAFEPFPPLGHPVVKAPRAMAGVIGTLAIRLGGIVPTGVEANYVRRSDAELLWRAT